MSSTKKLQGIKREQAERKRKLRNYLQRKAIRDYVEAVGGVGLPAKMPGTAYGIPAADCGVGSNLAVRKGSVCYRCYAKRNNYTYPSVIKAQAKRLESLRDLAAWTDAWCHIFDYLGTLLSYEERCHRWHDSGDVQSIEHLDAIVQVAKRNPEWRFWIPSKEYGIVSRYMEQHSIPSNLAVRMSAPYLNAEPNGAVRKLTGLTSTVGCNVGHGCPAGKQGGFCDTCRACWDRSETNVDYKEQ